MGTVCLVLFLCYVLFWACGGLWVNVKTRKCDSRHLWMWWFTEKELEDDTNGW